jgi:hypothetical protein
MKIKFLCQSQNILTDIVRLSLNLSDPLMVVGIKIVVVISILVQAAVVMAVWKQCFCKTN